MSTHTPAHRRGRRRRRRGRGRGVGEYRVHVDVADGGDSEGVADVAGSDHAVEGEGVDVVDHGVSDSILPEENRAILKSIEATHG